MNFFENWYTSYHWHKSNTGKVSWTTEVWFKRYEVLSLLHSHPRNCSSRAKKVFYPYMYDGRTDGWTRQWAKELTVNIFFDVFHILFKKKTFSHCMRNFSHSMRNFLHGHSASPSDSQDHPKAVSVTPRKFASPISSQRHP